MVENDLTAKRLPALLVLMLLMTVAGLSRAADIQVQTDREQVSMNQSFQIEFRARGSLSGDPDFTPLEKNFQVLSTSQSSNFTIINGEIESSKTWTLTVLPRHSGNLTIPAIAFGSDKSPRTSVMVAESGSEPDRDAAGDADVFLRVSAEPTDPYVQAEVEYNVKLYRAVPTPNASLEDPEVESGDAVIERIGDDSSYLARVNGKRYRVIERDYAVYPQASGKLTLAPLEFRGRVSRNDFSILDPFGPRPDMVVRRTDAVTLDVQPIPDGFSGGHWLPAKKVSLEEEWSKDPQGFRVGEPITRTLILKAEGQTASQLPELTDWVPDGFKDYPDQPVLGNEATASGMIASRREKVALIPQRAGEYTLPAIRVPWWNTATGKMEFAQVPERTVTVAASPGEQGQPDAQMTPAPPAQPEIPEPAPGDTTDRKPEGGKDEQQTDEAGFNPWLLLSGVLVLVWLITVGAWWISSRRHKSQEGHSGDGPRRVKRELKQACYRHDARGARDRLQQWGRLTWPDDPPLNPIEVGRRIDPKLQEAVRDLNAILYGNRAKDWNGEAFWRVFEESVQKRNRGPSKKEGDLEPLNRL